MQPFYLYVLPCILVLAASLRLPAQISITAADVATQLAVGNSLTSKAGTAGEVVEDRTGSRKHAFPRFFLLIWRFAGARLGGWRDVSPATGCW